MYKLEQLDSNDENVGYEEIEYIIYKLNTYIKLFENEKISKNDLKYEIEKISDSFKILYNYFPSDVHDLNNVIVLFMELFENKKYLKNIKDMLDKFVQKEFNEKEIMDLSSNIAKQLGLELDFNIFKFNKLDMNGFVEGNINFDSNGYVVSLDEGHFLYDKSIKDKLFELFGVMPSLYHEDINIDYNLSIKFKGPIHSIILNTIKNAKEAGATKIKIILLDSMFSDMVILKVIDNASGMDENTIKNILFKKGVSTKASSGTNMGVGMYELVKDFLSNGGELELYSKINGEKLEFNYHEISLEKDNIKPLNNFSEYYSIYETKIQGDNGSEFVFKFRN